MEEIGIGDIRLIPQGARIMLHLTNELSHAFLSAAGASVLAQALQTWADDARATHLSHTE